MDFYTFSLALGGAGLGAMSTEWARFDAHAIFDQRFQGPAPRPRNHPRFLEYRDVLLGALGITTAACNLDDAPS